MKERGGEIGEDGGVLLLSAGETRLLLQNQGTMIKEGQMKELRACFCFLDKE